jgi:beta propeller domain-containing protein
MTIHRPGLLAVLALTGGIIGCNPSPGKTAIHSAALVPLQSCGQAIDFVRQVALDRMNRKIDQAITDFGHGESCYQHAGGIGASAGGSNGGAPPSTSPAEGDQAQAQNASGTNNQVAGVDEADFVKNDGKYVYLAQNGALRIIDAYPGSQAHQLSKTVLDGTPRKLFVVGDRALVYVSVPNAHVDPTTGGRYGGAHECTYGYDCDFTGDGTSTKLELFDVADRAQPRKLRELFVSGSLIAARRIGNAVHTVVADNIVLFPELEYWPDVDLCASASSAPITLGGSPSFAALDQARLAYESLRAKNRKIILTKDIGAILPRLADDAFGGTTLGDEAQLCTSLYRASLADGASFTTLVSVDLAATAPAHTTSIVSSPGAVYASEDALYIAVPSEQSACSGWYSDYGSVQQLSTLHKFQISDNVADSRYLASGVVQGRVLNQFSMDERDHFLRIATTSGHVPDPKVESQLGVFTESSGTLSKVGEVAHIAPGEDIRSVRFDGEHGFVVTFKKTDPLFVLDLAEPTHPQLVGELKIPGFSTYLHMLDAQHILSIGFDADDHDSFAFFNGVLLQIFDVSDPKNPLLAHRYSIGTRGSASAALTDHLAFNYFAPLKMLAVPMTICEGGGDGMYGTDLTFSGLMLFDIDVTTGIHEHGRVPHPLPDLASTPYGSGGCYNWWSESSSDVKRSIFMDQWVYSISDQLLQVESMDTLGSDVASIDLEPAPAP